MLEQLVDVKSRSPGDDLVSALIAARDGDERLDNRELLSTIFQLIVAGHDTTASFIGNSVVALFRNPDQLALRGDPGRLATALEEFLRFDAPVPHSTFRYAVEPVALGGATIPAGPKSSSAWRQPTATSAYDDPEALDIDRSGVRHLAFGHGSITASAPRSPAWRARPRHAAAPLPTAATRSRRRRAAVGSRRRARAPRALRAAGDSWPGDAEIANGPNFPDRFADRVTLRCPVAGGRRRFPGGLEKRRARTMSMTGTPVDNGVNVAALLEAGRP